MRGGGDLGGFAPGAMVAPEIIVVERLQVLVDRDDARAGGVERDRFDRRARRRRRSRWRARVASAKARMWSAWLCVAWSGSSFLRCSGYSAMPEPSRPRSLSKMETRTLSVPKSTPATMLIDASTCDLVRSASSQPR